MQSAQAWAQTQLTHRFHEEFIKIYEKELRALSDQPFNTDIEKRKVRSKAQGKAKTELRRRHLLEYKVMYAAAIQQGYPSRNVPELPQ
jgi:hypothetical protein